MPAREITLIGDDVLRQKARRVRDFDEKLHTLLDDMEATLTEASGAGLAAPQVGVSERVLIVRLADDEEEYGDDAGVLYEVVNPEIVRASREMVEGAEACLSIPGYYGMVDRHEMIVLRGQDRYGKEFRMRPRGWLARVFQHEIDHLDGILYIDRTEEVWRVGEEDEVGEASEAAATDQAAEATA